MPATIPTERVDFWCRGIAMRGVADAACPAADRIRPSCWRTGSARRTT